MAEFIDPAEPIRSFNEALRFGIGLQERRRERAEDIERETQRYDLEQQRMGLYRQQLEDQANIQREKLEWEKKERELIIAEKMRESGDIDGEQYAKITNAKLGTNFIHAKETDTSDWFINPDDKKIYLKPKKSGTQPIELGDIGDFGYTLGKEGQISLTKPAPSEPKLESLLSPTEERMQIKDIDEARMKARKSEDKLRFYERQYANFDKDDVDEYLSGEEDSPPIAEIIDDGGDKRKVNLEEYRDILNKYRKDKKGWEEQADRLQGIGKQHRKEQMVAPGPMLPEKTTQETKSSIDKYFQGIGAK